MSSEVMIARLARALDLTNALADDLAPPNLQAHNGKAKSNTIGGQFWCLVGARESYARAIEGGKWAGFACSLTGNQAHDPAALKVALKQSKDRVRAAIEGAGDLDAARLELLMDLNEHETQHHGQLIRFFYANDIAFPAAFAARYAL